jgi:hypothetical protein
MRILFDQGTPAPLRHHLLNHTVATAYEQGWSELNNGTLLSAGENAGFDLLITTDHSIRTNRTSQNGVLRLSFYPPHVGLKSAIIPRTWSRPSTPPNLDRIRN